TRNEEICPAVVIYVYGNNPQSPPCQSLKTCPGGYVSECAIAIIVVKSWRIALVRDLLAVTSPAGHLTALGIRERKFHVITDEQIKKAIAIVIEPCGTRTPFTCIEEACLFGYIDKVAVAGVVK